MAESKIIKFKFKSVDENGNEEGFFNKKGFFDGKTLKLDDTDLPVEIIVRAIRRANRIVLGIFQEDGQVAPAIIAINSGNVRELVSAINIGTSVRWAKMRKEALEKEGRGAEFRIEKCPHCKAVVDLTGNRESAQMYCGYCDAVATRQGSPPADESKYRICDECGFYAQPKEFTIFYFVFLVVVYYFSYRKIHLCNTCMRGEAWKMFFGNFLFILGLPVAIVQLCRAYFGGSTFSQAFAGLDKGNALAKKGKVEAATAIYGEIETRLMACAGVRFNHGVVLASARQHEPAVEQFRKALDDCSNYAPAYEGLAGCLRSLGRNDELLALQKDWGDVQEEPKAE